MSEIGRRVVHAAGVGFPALYLLNFLSWSQLRWLLVAGSLIALILETLRLRVGIDWWIYRRLTRPYESDQIAGYALYMLSITLVGVLFQPEVAIPAMLMLMIGDPVSGYLGTGSVRTIKRPRALLGMFLVSLAVSYPFAFAVIEDPAWSLVVAMIAAAGGTIADGVTIRIGERIVDDNITIPLIASVVLWVAYSLV